MKKPGMLKHNLQMDNNPKLKVIDKDKVRNRDAQDKEHNRNFMWDELQILVINRFRVSQSD